jgi:predicted lactoylglutathione lyase
MATKIFVNLPVSNLQHSISFFSELGYTFNQQFTDDSAACMVIGQDIYAMLLTHEKFGQFTSKPIANARQHTEVLLALSSETREPQDYGFMYGRSFEDLDGHIWEVIWMDPAAIQ